MGTYTDVITCAPGTLAAANYTFATGDKGDLQITRRPITVTADDKTKTYGDSDPSLTYQVTSGSLASGDSFTGALTRDPGQDVGGYAIRRGTLAISDGNGGANYDLTFVTGTLTITKATLSVNADDKTKTYGDPDPSPTYTLSGFKFGENATTAGVSGAPSCSYGSHSQNVGTYTDVITCAPGTLAAANYTFATGDKGDLQITKATLTVTADDKIMTLNDSLPTFTGTVTGVKNGDNITATYSTTADGHTVGTFPIVPELHDPDSRLPNYNVTLVNGTLTVRYVAGGSCLGSPGHAILQPINADGTSVFKQGSTVPAKFRVCDANGNSVGTPGVVADFKLIRKVSGTEDTSVNETVASTTPDTAFRWSSTDQQWIFNVNTKALSKNYTYYYRITLNDGSTIDFQFGLK